MIVQLLGLGRKTGGLEERGIKNHQKSWDTKMVKHFEMKLCIN